MLGLIIQKRRLFSCQLPYTSPSQEALMTWNVFALQLFLFVSAIVPQAGNGAITGTIRDPDKNAVAGASVFAKNVTSGTPFKTNSSRTGTFSISGLPSGTYELAVPDIGFSYRAQTKKDLAVQAGQTLRSDFALEWSANLGTVGDDTFLTIRNRYAGLTGPTPRMPDGTPDFSGMWNGSEDPHREPPSALDWALAIQKERFANSFKDAPSGFCLPGEVFPSSPLLYKFVQTPTLLLQVTEDVTPYRQTFLDGRGHPKDPDPNWKGHSIGKWEGDTLVVDTVGFNDKSWLTDGLPHTEKLHVIERYRRPDLAHLVIDVTIEDPETLTKPWNLHMNWQLAPGYELIEYICPENNLYKPLSAEK